MDRDTWIFINTFAPWVAALATIAAVITSLYLARRADRTRLRISCGIRTIAVEGGGPGHGTRWVFISVTNTGRRAATITSMFWRPVHWLKAGLVLIPPVNVYSSRFPITLTDGQTANWAVSIDRFQRNFADHARKYFTGCRGAVRLRLTRMCVGTSTGEVVKTRMEKELRQLVRTMAKTSAGQGESGS